jgi:hypothetical protein
MPVPSNDENESPDYALSRARIDALLTPLTAEELEQARRERAAGVGMGPFEQEGTHHLSVTMPDEAR